MHHLLLNHITPADTALTNLLNGKAKLFTTRCVHEELKSLGDSYSETFKASQNLITARCDHERRKSAASCVMEIVGESNPEHFFVATQDKELMKKFKEMPGVPVIFGLRNALFIEQPSASERKFVKFKEEEHLHMTDLEIKMLKSKRQDRLAARESFGANEGLGDQVLGSETVVKANIGRKRMAVNDKAQFKRKKAKGPNPLSCMKKKNHHNENLQTYKEGEAADTSGRSRSRKRKRSRKDKKLGDSDGIIL